MNETVLIDGSVVLQGGSVTVIQGAAGVAPLVVNGSLTLGGTLTVLLPATASDGQQVPVVSVTGSGQVNGTFANVTVKAANRKCERVSGSYEQGSLAVLVGVDSSGCSGSHGGLSTAAIAGVVVGGLVGVALLTLLPAWYFWRRRKDALKGAVYDRDAY